MAKKTRPQPVNIKDFVSVPTACGHGMLVSPLVAEDYKPGSGKKVNLLCPNCQFLRSLGMEVKIVDFTFFPTYTVYLGVKFIREDLTKLESIRMDIKKQRALILACYDLMSFYPFGPENPGLNQVVHKIQDALEGLPRFVDQPPTPDDWYGVSVPALVNAARNAYQVIKDPYGSRDRSRLMLEELQKVLAPLKLDDLKDATVNPDPVSLAMKTDEELFNELKSRGYYGLIQNRKDPK